MNKKLKIILLIIILTFLAFHFHSHLKKNNTLEILQINYKLDHSKYSNYFRDKLPIVFIDHSQQDLANIISPLTISQSTIESNQLTKIMLGKDLSSHYTYHNKDMLFIFANQDTSINILPPDKFSLFQKTQEKKNIFSFYKLINSPEKEETSLYPTTSPPTPIQIRLNAGMVLYIPRYWLFEIGSGISIYHTTSIFSALFGLFV